MTAGGAQPWSSKKPYATRRHGVSPRVPRRHGGRPPVRGMRAEASAVTAPVQAGGFADDVRAGAHGAASSLHRPPHALDGGRRSEHGGVRRQIRESVYRHTAPTLVTARRAGRSVARIGGTGHRQACTGPRFFLSTPQFFLRTTRFFLRTTRVFRTWTRMSRTGTRVARLAARIGTPAARSAGRSTGLGEPAAPRGRQAAGLVARRGGFLAGLDIPGEAVVSLSTRK